MSTRFSGNDIIDSRDVISRIEELELFDEDDELDDDDREELNLLRSFAEELEGYGDWAHGEALISDDYFEEYAEQLAGDIGAIDPNAHWPITHIDWAAAAEALKADYMSAELDGETYWMRS